MANGRADVQATLGRGAQPGPPGAFGAGLLACSVLVVASLVATVALVLV